MKRLNVTISVIALAIGLTMISCGGGNSKQQEATPETQTKQPEQVVNKQDPVAAFAQFGVDIEKIKPNVAPANNAIIKTETNVADNNEMPGNYKAAWVEMGENPVSKDDILAYNERVFQYVKSISADGKCYGAKVPTVEPTSYETYASMPGSTNWTPALDFSFKSKGGLWVNVFFSSVDRDKSIGVKMRGIEKIK